MFFINNNIIFCNIVKYLIKTLKYILRKKLIKIHFITFKYYNIVISRIR